ncbi:MAG TPA: redoxin domain-containing protein [Thermoanaerobaculia bacterium]|nr:redoxin domain-containing protein [Thermoanaerobaculia bacterium]
MITPSIWSLAVVVTLATAQQTPPTATPPPTAETPKAAAPASQATTPKAEAPKAAPAAAPAIKTPGMTRYRMTAGDVTGDKIAESIVYDSDTKSIRITGYADAAPIQTMGMYLKDVPTRMVTADLDGDGKAELITGEGLGGYNPKEGPQTDVTLKIYKPAAKGDWSPVELYRKATERPEVTSLRVKDLDGDGRKDILFAYFASKYVSELRIARQGEKGWSIEELPTIRMGAHIDAGDVLQNGKQSVVVGRPYGDPADPKSTTAIGDAFVLDGQTRIPLPVTRGVSAVAVGDLDGKPGDEIVVGDGWHANYGKLARCRIAVISRQSGAWKYELIEDFDDHMRFEQIDLVDLNGDGRNEIVAHGAMNAALGGTVRVYERANGKWRGMTVAPLAQAYAAGDFDGDKKTELVFTGQPPLPFSITAKAPQWDSRLGEEIQTRDVDPKSLLSKPAPALQMTEWFGSTPLTLASLKGKVVMLDFWATWCKPCIAMYPEMREWASQFGPEGLVILGITNHSRQTSAQVSRFFTREKLPWPVAVDPKSKTHVEYGVGAIPHTFLIDRHGIVRFEHRGGGDLSAIKNKLKELLAEKSAETK